jgi:nucleotide-binding universal stress UspA family protein
MSKGRATRPAMSFNPREFLMKILLAVDGSPGSLGAVRHVLQLVREGLQTSVVLVNVQEPASLYEVVVAHDAQVIEQIRDAAGAHALVAAEALLRAAGVSFESEVVGGDPGHMLVDVAQRVGADLLVMGARGSGDTRAALGSAATAVLHAALDAPPTPVTIVREPEA